jgi:hypothetical protein
MSESDRPEEGEPRGKQYLQVLRHEVLTWCGGKRWWHWRLPFLLFFAYILVRHLASPDYQSIFKGLNLGIHELGHMVFGLLGEFIGVAGGTLLQCLVPIGSVFMFLRQRDFFAIAVCFGWLSTNLFDVATYAGDARAMELPLVSPGVGDVIHDWNYLLGHPGLLQADQAIAFLFRVGAVLSMAICLVAGGWLLWRMYRRPVEVQE